MTEREVFDTDTLRSRLAGRMIGRSLHFYQTVDSTNRVAMGLVREGAPEGTVVFADGQTEGRGRLKRVWQSPPGLNIYASFLLRPKIMTTDASRITLMAGVAVAEMISFFCPVGVGLKWPNDIQIRGRKICGILAEMKMIGESLDAVVVGIGLNVNMVGMDFDPAHRETSTSLREEMGRTFCREDVAFHLCEQFERWYRIFLGEGFAPVRERWLSRTEMVGRHVRVLFNQEVQEGVVAGIDQDGALLLADEVGAVRRITAGDAGIMKG